ncbi:odorant receptor 131-2-like [Engraulis encrasicolus]|uniref:odorant receptor 131-2-like n=1 Tax=Engraulis encrasicolus TaxID=184585 RepID=UPI002FCFC8E1
MANLSSEEDGPLVHQQSFQVEMNEGPLSKLVVAILMALLFMYINSIMFHTVLSKPVFRELPRYILFAHMLCNDTILLMTASVLYVLSLNFQKLPRAVCAPIMLVASAGVRISALNLGFMSLERYVAICFPLRHSEMASKKMAAALIATMWILGCISPVIDILHPLIRKPASFGKPMFCTHQAFFIAPWQVAVFEGIQGFYFVAVTFMIIFTYVSVMVAARSASADKDSARKAQRTVLLHFGQLVLCLNSLLYVTIERAMAMASSSHLFMDLRYMNYLFILLLPRCLSPLVYGLRDNAVRPLFLYYVRCGYRKVKPSVTVH